MTDRESIEQAASAYRELDPTGALRPSPAWADLDDSEREESFRLSQHLRTLESIHDPEGLNGTLRAVLSRLNL